MERLYARIIELIVIVVIGLIIYAVREIKDAIKYHKWEKEWIENSFEYKGARWHKKFFRIENGELKTNREEC